MTRVAAVDCGTNSIRLLVLERDAEGRTVELDRRLELVRLGQGVDATGEFHPDALERTFAATDRFAAVMRELGVERVRFVATSAARDARNRELFFEGIKSRVGVLPEVISGDEEARLSFAGALAGVEPSVGPVLVVDCGGGSTELVQGGTDAQVQHATSLDIGSVRLRERFLHDDPPTPEQVAAARAHVDSLLDASGIDFDAVRSFIGVAGTATSLSAITQGLREYQRDLVHRSQLTREQLSSAADWLLTTPWRQVEAETCLPAKRAEVSCGGALIVASVAQRVQPAMVVSESDILDALAIGLLA